MKDARQMAHIAGAAITALVALGAAALAISNQPAAQSFFLAAVGILYLVVPPSGRVPRVLLGGAIFILFVAAVPLLPASWIGSPFREAFIGHGFGLPSTASMQPWWTLEDLTLLLATFLWAWNCLENKLGPDQRSYLQKGFIIFLGTVALAAIVPHVLKEAGVPSWLRNWGQFANRNQTADLLVMGGVSAGIIGLHRFKNGRTGSAVGWLALTVLFVEAAIDNGSRAGLILLIVGLAAASFFVQGGRQVMGWKAPLGTLAVIGLMLLITGGALLHRIESGFRSGGESRLPIYEDAVSLITHGSWHGIGAGNFEGVFNTVRIESRGEMFRNLHPESDWLWTGVELGWAGLLATFILVAFGLRVFLLGFPSSAVEQAARVIAVLFLVHGLVDVGAHRIGTLWPCLYLVGLGVWKDRNLKVWPVPRPAFRALGFSLLVVAGLRVQALSLTPWMPIRGSIEVAEAYLHQGASTAEQKAVLDRTLTWAPLDWKLYWERGMWSIHDSQSTESAKDDFNRALYLDQSSIELPVALGEVYRRIDFEEALPVWEVALGRAGYRREEIYRNLYLYPGLDTRSRLEMMALAGNDPNLKILSVIYQNSPEFDEERINLLGIDPDLKDVSPENLEKFLDRWVEIGNLKEFFLNWSLHPSWREAGRLAYGKALAKQNKIEQP